MSPATGFGPVERERADARRRLEAVRARLRDGTAAPEDHREALNALMVLPKAESERWLEEIRTGFTPVYARRRER